MTEEKSAEIKRLAGIAFDKQQQFKLVGATNIPLDLSKARELYELYAKAQYEYEQAWTNLKAEIGKRDQS